MKKKTLYVLINVLFSMLFCSLTVLAITDAEVQTAVDSSSKESVTGNLLIWFLCAIAFLKVSQKIDSFMSSLGISVGRTGGSMMSEMMIIAKAVGGAFKGTGKFAGFGKGGSGSSAPAGSGGILGGIGKKMAWGATGFANGSEKSGGFVGAIGRKMYGSSLNSGGKFAAGVIGSIARGERSQMGSITGANAKSAMESYFGYNATKNSTVGGSVKKENSTSFKSDEKVSGTVNNPTAMDTIPQFSDMEIGGGRITGMETTKAFPDGVQFAMYDAEKFDKPDGKFEMSTAIDGSKWYKQYAQPSVEKTPYMDHKGKVAYKEKIVSKLPKAPIRKDKI